MIASNHIAGIDVVVLGAASPRTLRYMAKAELFTYNRALDLDAAATPAPSACAAASPTSRRCGWRGACCAPAIRSGVFFEGTRQPSEEIGRVQPGAALIALAEGAPIVPVVIQGTIYIKQSLRTP